MKPICLLLLIIFSSHTYSQENRTVILGKIKSDSIAIEGAHVINLTSKVGIVSDALGKFEIPVKLNDTILFSDIQYENIWIIINEINLNEKYLEVDFQININELDEILIEKVDNMATTLGLPNAGKTPLTQAERKVNYYKKSGNITKLFGLISGEQKKRKKLERLESEDVENNANRKEIINIRNYFKDDFFIETLQIQEIEINNFITYCMSKGVIDLYKKERYLEVMDILLKQSKTFRN